MTRRTKLILWVICIPIIAFLVSRFRPPGEINIPPTHVHSTYAASPQGSRILPGHEAVVTGSPSESIQPKPSTSARMASAGFARNGDSSSLSISELYRLMDAKPSTIESLNFTNGTNNVSVERIDGSTIDVILPDDGGKQDLRARAVADQIPFDVSVLRVDPVAEFMKANAVGLLILAAVIGFAMLNRAKMAKQMKGINGMGSARAKDAADLQGKIKKAKFEDVAGCDEAVKELRRVVSGLVGAEIYSMFHAELPKGILLIGPPGTGKTHLARAVAGETGGTFDITSGSEFVEMLVGVGASRVRDMFDRARKKVAKTGKPHIIFIDEIDAIGGKRGGGTASGSNSEREQTLNQILVEMDGMVGNDGILIIAATNRVDMLDDALLRQGRFDCHVSVDLPDKAGREAIFKIHLADILADGIFLAEDVTLPVLAHRTYGYSGAEIKGVCNRAKILASERNAPAIRALKAEGKKDAEIKKLMRLEVLLTEFDEAVDFVRFGNSVESKQKEMAAADKKETSVHEGGHAVVAAALPHCDPVVKITIMRRSRALGYVQYLPENDRVSLNRNQALARIIGMMAGRAAQMTILGTCDTGASNDFQQATDPPRSPPPSPATQPGSLLHRPLMEARNGVERGQDRALLPGRQIGRMLAGQHQPAVEGAQILVMRRPALVGPIAGAAQGEGRTMPGDGDAVFEFVLILRMDLRSEGDRAPDPLGRRQGGELIGVRPVIQVGAQQHALAAGVHAVLRIADSVDRQIGEADAAEDRLILLPEPPFELQPNLDRRGIGHNRHRVLHLVADIGRDLRQHRQRDGADAPVGGLGMRCAARPGVCPGDGHLTLVLLDTDDLGIILDQVADPRRECLADAIRSSRPSYG